MKTFLSRQHIKEKIIQVCDDFNQAVKTAKKQDRTERESKMKEFEMLQKQKETNDPVKFTEESPSIYKHGDYLKKHDFESLKAFN